MTIRKITRSLTATLATAVLTILPYSLDAQDNGLLIRKLSTPDGTGGARINVTENGEAASILRMMSSTRRSSSISVYRVRVFFDNSQNARAEAYSTLNRFNEMFPEVPADLKYEVPYFRVTAGYCLTKEEAIILWGRLKNTFPKAFLIPEPEDIPIETFVRYSETIPNEEELEDAEVEAGN